MLHTDVWHSGSPNQTEDQTRRVMQVHYCSALIGHPELPRAVPDTLPEVILSANARQQRLLAGYAEPGQA